MPDQPGRSYNQTEMISEDEEWELRLENARLRARVFELEQSIAKHRAADGNDLCWENNLELWATLKDDVPYPHKSIPPWPQFLSNCVKYRAQLDAPQPIAPSASKPLDRWFDSKWTGILNAASKTKR